MKMGQFNIPIIATLLSLMGLALLMSLGFWQLDRAEQKRVRQQQIIARSLHSPYPIAQLLASQSDVRDWPVMLTGRLWQQQYWLWDNRIFHGQVGYEVIAIVHSGVGPVLVNLGWIKAPSRRDILPDYRLPQQPVTIQGVAAVPQDNPWIDAGDDGVTENRRRLAQINIARLSTLTGLPLLPLVVYAKKGTGLPDNWQPVVMPAAKHVAYAIQWFGLAAALLVIYVIAVVRQNRRLHE